ncbi:MULTISPECIES: PD-(D/E)XK nuclease-like domain-containing protein [Streptomycetaceae]|uniref:Gp60 protein n=1 Tax=Streptantibioticus cattleyicolor (strain ATCC 35852 / DSM 46488 / JCM 4925 / NBRC 14057 / NRRL 8057) TaxID=1003195 RepID=F8JY68_STREN|nr:MULTISPECIES: PD-(D/E)XK nuclease-like domain-containing protein [Streptomycetaceae]AEW94644.1 gp60 protein [Streptantibioticus cattleyicolor NRRL 8057 = DSM 46488]MYS59282.1 hypothetical protein [Streptomyces sp. SID5468]CCB75001.1 Gp60 protein [Streptantibioticus cattleyicolor NRRL 8057 = DSM 46488]
MGETVSAGAPAAPAAGRAPVTEPGVYPDMPIEAYHRDPALSSTGARRLLPPGCPALYRYEQDHPQPPSTAFELGTAAHRLVLGVGPDLVVVDAEDWRTRDARARRDAARAAGAVPLLAAEYALVQAMAAALRRHPVAGVLFAPGSGRPEVSVFWRDRATGVMLRERPDWLPYQRPGARLIVPDYKTAVALDDDALSRAIAAHGYHQQAAWYLDGLRATGLAGEDAAFVFVFQLKAPPHLVRTVQLPMLAERIGRAKNRAAIETFADCQRTGRWPGYGDDVAHLSLPPWAEKTEAEEYL